MTCRTLLAFPVVILLFAALGGGCGGRGSQKPDGGGDAHDATTDVGTDAEKDTAGADGALDVLDAPVERGDAVDAVDSTEPEPICVSNVKEAPVCGKSKCGNGKRDICLVTACVDGTVYSPKEACDGVDLGAESCTASGYASGAVACSSKCDVDRSGCRTCFPVDTTLVACNEARLPARLADAVQVAATDSAIALAWSGGEGGPQQVTPVLNLARLSPTLEVLGTTELERILPAPGAQSSIRSVAVVPLGTGWLVGALADETRVLLHRVDATGQDLGRVTLDTLADDDFTLKFVTLAARPTGGAIAVWSSTGGISAAPIAGDGTVGTKTTFSLASLVNVSVSNAVWLGDAAFLILSASTAVDLDRRATLLLRFGTEGSAPSVVATLFADATGPRGLAADADELLYSYGGADDMLLARFDVKGKATATPVVTTTTVEAITSAGDDAILVSPDATGVALSFERRTRAGTFVGQRHGLTRGPDSFVLLGYSAARRGPETIVAWIGGPGSKTDIGVARLAQ